jgi:hypothetical protein
MKRLTIFILVIVCPLAAICGAAQAGDGSILNKDLTGLGRLIRGVWNLVVGAGLVISVISACVGYRRLSLNKPNGGTPLALGVGGLILFSILFVGC